MTDLDQKTHRVASRLLRRRDFFRLSGALGAGLALTSLLAACGSDDEPSPTTTSGASDSSSGSDNATPGGSDDATESSAGDSAEEMIVAVTPDPLSMSPWLPSSMTGFSIHHHVYEPVIFRDENMELIPRLAETWEQIEPDVLQLNLQQGINFHDGEPFTSAAVKFSLENIIAPDSKSVHKPPLSSISEIETPDDYTVLIRTNEPNRALLRNLTIAGIMSETFYNSINGDWANNAIGTGPYKFVEYLPGNRVVLERNEEYWGEKPFLRRLEFRVITENGTRIAALKSGDVSMINNVPPDQAEGIDSTDGLKILTTPTGRVVFCGLRIDRPVFEDLRVRQAVNYAINKDEIVNDLFRGLTQSATGPLAPMIYAANPDLEPWPYDPDKARQLLEEAGNPNPKIVFGTANGRYINDRQVGEAIAGYLTEVGFEIDFYAPEWGDYYSEVFTKEKSRYDMFLLAWGVSSMEPDFLLRDFFHSDFADWTAYSNPRVDELLDTAAETFDDAEVKELLGEAQALIRDDCSWAWLYYQPEIHGITEKLVDYGPRPDEYIVFRTAKLLTD